MKKHILIFSVFLITNTIESGLRKKSAKLKELLEEVKETGIYGDAFPSAGRKY